MPELPDVLAALQAATNACKAASADSVLIGGLALASHGYIRATDDVDLCLHLEKDDPRVPALLEQLAAHGLRLDQAAVTRRFERGLNLFRMYWRRVRIDVMLRRPDGYWDGVLRHAVAIERGDLRLRVASAEDLIALKLIAGRPQDLADVERLLEIAGPTLDRARLEAEVRRLHALRPERRLDDLLVAIDPE